MIGRLPQDIASRYGEMRMAIPVHDPNDPRLDEFRDLKGRSHADTDHLVVESPIAVERLLTSQYPVRAIVTTLANLPRVREFPRSDDATVYVVEPVVLERVLGFDLHRGVIASATRVPGPDLDDLAGARRLLVVEGCNDTENLGAMARAARAFGVEALVLDPTSADPLSRRAIRVSMGEMLHLPIARCATWPDPLARLVAGGMEAWALTPDRGAERLYGRPFPARLALVVGAEGPGLTMRAMEACSHRVRIPIAKGVDSLNIGHAAAVAMAATSYVSD
jgi:tRNA G18 (ribose-2'-O)-methylase SpoU